MAKIIRVWGKADSFDIELTEKGGRWEVNVPPDLVDGVYAVELTAIDSLTKRAHWAGELYMCNGVCCMQLRQLNYDIVLSKAINKSAYPVQLTVSKYEIVMRKGCPHV